MYVELPTSWLSHDFLTNNFKIGNENQLAQLRRLNLTEIEVNLEKSDTFAVIEPRADTTPVSENKIVSESAHPDARYQRPPKQWSTDKLMTDDLRNILDDKQLPAEKKSRAIYNHSVDMMDQLLAFPTVENIHSSKEAIYALSDSVLADDETALNLMRITSHDYYTYTHSVNVGITSILLSKELYAKSDGHDLHELAAGFFLHDLGKVNIDPNVLNKPGKLNDTEMQHIKTHPYQGYKILKEANALSEECAIIVLQHHEAFNGTGYPRRLKRDEIHSYGQICAIADIYDALTSERSYKKAMPPFEALKVMKEAMANRFESQLFARFVQLFMKD